MTKQDVLQQCTVEGTTVKLPPEQLDRKLYMEVAKSLELIGGKWKGGKIAGFVFQQDPTELLQQIAGGESRNLKKEFQFFATPAKIADQLVYLADIDGSKADPEQLILEPSAGQGAILDALKKVCRKDQLIHCFELMEVNQSILNKRNDIVFLGADFLTNNFDNGIKFHKIIANPPFAKNQDIDHITEMYKHLADNGTLVSIASKHWQLSTNKKETDFKNWLDSVDATIYEIESGEFKDSGTMVGTCIIVIDK